jgi:hypothetical protein
MSSDELILLLWAIPVVSFLLWLRAKQASLNRMVWRSVLKSWRRVLGLIRSRGHNPKGGYDVHDVRYETEANAAELY